MPEQWASTTDHAPAPAAAPQTQAAAADQWASTADHAQVPTLRPGMTDDEIMRHYGYDPAVIKKAHLYSPGNLSGYMAQPDRPEWLRKITDTVGDSFVGDMGYGVAGPAAGVTQLAAHLLNKIGVASDADKQYTDLMTRLVHEDYEQNTRHGHPGMAGQIIAQMLIPGMGALKGASTAVNTARIVGGGMIAGTMQPVDVDGPNGDYWKQKATQTATGGVVAPVVHGVVTGLTTGAGKVIDRAIASRRGTIPPAAQELFDQAAHHKVEGLTYGDVTGHAGAQKVDTALEEIPFVGIGPQRAKQQVDVKAAAGRVADRLRQAVDSTDFEGLPDIEKAAQGGDADAKRVLDLVKAAGTDPDRIQQASLNIRNFLTKREAGSKYDGVRTLAENLPDNHVSAPQTIDAIGGVMKDLQGLKLDTSDKTRMVSMFDKLRENLKGPSNPYGEMMTLSDQLGAQIDDYYQGPHKAVGAPGVQYLQRVKNAVDADMRAFTRSGEASTPGSAKEGWEAVQGLKQAATERLRGETPAPGTAAGAPPAARGPETTITVPGDTSSRYKARYEVRELADVQPSHNGESFNENPRYAYANDRNYNTVGNQRKVVEWATESQFDPGYHITDNPDAVNGPAIIDHEGNVLGGNGRSMMLQRVYKNDGQAAAAYRQMLEDRAQRFGIDPEQVAGMKQPVLVRVLDDAHLDSPEAARNAITDFNKVGTAALTPSEQAIADARRVSPETLSGISKRLEELGPDATLAQAIEGPPGVEVLHQLISDKVISPQEGAKYFTEEGLTKAGKDRVSQLLLGRFFRDADQLDRLPASIKNKLERVAGPLAKLEAHGDFSLTQHVKEGIDLMETARRAGMPLDDYLQQGSLTARQDWSPEAQAVAHGFTHGNPLEIVRAVNQYGEHAKYASEYQGPGLFNELPDPHTPRSAFNHSFGTEIPEGGERKLPEPAPIPQKSADFDQAFERPKNSRAQTEAIGKAHTEADDFYKQERVPFKDRTTGNAIKSDEPDTVYGKFIQAGKGDRAQKYYNTLDEKGRAAVRYGMVADAIDKATHPSTGIFSPQKFVNALSKLDEAKGVFFKGKDKWEIDGFQNLMAHVTRAGQYAENPPTGKRAVAFMVGGGIAQGAVGFFSGLAGAASATGTAAMIGGARLLFTTPAGRDFLLRSSSLKPGTAAMSKLADQILGAKLSQAAARVTSIEEGRAVEPAQPATPPNRRNTATR